MNSALLVYQRGDYVWSLPRYKARWREVCAILPIYLPDGRNGCAVHYADGTKEQFGARLSWVLDDFFGYRRSSREILQNQSSQWLARLGSPQRRRLPLVLTDGHCYVPVKIRQPISRNHAADGYVLLAQVREIAGNHQDNQCVITLDNGSQITVLDSVRTLRDNLQLAQALEQCLD